MKHSDSIDSILPALAKAESEFPALKKTGSNTYFKSKYLQLDDLLDEIKPILRANNIFLMQWATSPSQGDMTAEITTRFWHVPSGEWIEVSFTGQYGDDKGVSIIQSFGKTYTYLRRYEIVGFFSLGTEDDNDGNLSGDAGSKTGQQTGQKPQAQTGKPPVPTMTTSQFAEKWASLFGGDGDRAKAALSSVIPPGKTWGAVKNDGAWLHATYTAMQAELVAAAKKQEDDLASELAQLAGDSAAGTDNPYEGMENIDSITGEPKKILG